MQLQLQQQPKQQWKQHIGNERHVTSLFQCLGQLSESPDPTPHSALVFHPGEPTKL